MKSKIYRVTKYLIVCLVSIWSIYNIIHYSIKMNKDYNSAYLLGIVVYAVILLTSIICLVLLIKKAIYRSKFTHNDYK